MMMRKTTATIAACLLSLTGVAHAAGNVEKGGDLAYDCFSCHGMEGQGNFETPAIAGLDEAYILERLRNFCKGGESMDGMMNLYTEGRSDQELQDLAAYWASLQKPQQSP